MSTVSALVVAVLFGTGVYLLLQRTLSRIILGLALMAHAANLLRMVVGGRAGRPAIVGGIAEGATVELQALALDVELLEKAPPERRRASVMISSDEPQKTGTDA